MMSFGHALARVAIADGTVDALERAAMIDALQSRRIFSGSELDLVVDLALSQALAWQDVSGKPAEREALQQAAEAVAMADSVLTEEEKTVIRQLLDGGGAEA
jgi:tellurite resistance protein